MGKGKNKKNRGKSARVSKQHGTSSSIMGPPPALSDIYISGSVEYEKGSSPPRSEYNSRMLEELLMEKVELIYKIALEKLVELGYRMDLAMRAMLMNGSVFGGKNILSNILLNTLASITNGQATKDPDMEPIFEDVRELARFSMQTLINLIVQDRANMTKMDAVLYLLQSESLSVHESSRDVSHSKGHKDPGTNKKKGISDIDIGKMLKENTIDLHRMNISTSTPAPCSSSSSQVAINLISEPAERTTPYVISSGSSSDVSESDSTVVKKFATDFPDGMSLGDWLRNAEKDTKDDICLRLVEKIEKIQIKVKERREWAKRIAIESAKKFSETRMELQDLKLHKKETDDLLKQIEELECCHSELREKENFLRNLNHDIAIVNQVQSILEAKNSEYRTELAAYSLSTSESEKSHLETQKNERKTLRKAKDTEKHVADLRGFIGREKQQLDEMAHRMEQVNEAIEQAKLRLKQEKEAKQQAHALLLEEKRLNRVEKENSKSRLVSVRRELDLKYQKMMDEQNRLAYELSQLKAKRSSKKSASSSSAAAALDRPKRSRRTCMICRRNDVSIVFLPCAHQVLCVECNDEVYESLEDLCPCCMNRIEKRVKVFGPGS